MIKVVHKRKRLSEEYYNKLSEDSRKEKLRYQKRKAAKPKRRLLTKEEKEERAKNFYKKVEKERKEIDSWGKPITIIEIMQEIRKIYRCGELEELASKTGIQ